MDPLKFLALLLCGLILLLGTAIFLIGLRSSHQYRQLPLMIRQGNWLFTANFILITAFMGYHLYRLIFSS